MLHRLDQIEVTNQPGIPDLYYRAVVDSFDESGRPLGPAHTYFYASDPVDDGFAPGGSMWPMETR